MIVFLVLLGLALVFYLLYWALFLLFLAVTAIRTRFWRIRRP